MHWTREANEDGLLLHGVTAVCGAGIDRVRVVETSTHGEALDELIAHSWRIEVETTGWGFLERRGAYNVRQRARREERSDGDRKVF